MNSFVLPVVVSTVSAIPAVLFALWLDRLSSRRALAARLGEYADPERAPGGWQPWRSGFYDIRDWAGSIKGYLAHGDAREMEFGFIRVPGHRYVEHLVSTNRVPEEHLQQAIILGEYCELLANAFAHVVAAEARGDERPEDRPLHELGAAIGCAPTARESAVVQLAEAVCEMASELPTLSGQVASINANWSACSRRGQAERVGPLCCLPGQDRCSLSESAHVSGCSTSLHWVLEVVP